MQKHQKSLQITAQNSVNVGNGYRNITYQGKNYQYNSLITTILYAGVDSEGKLDSDVTYSNKERADSISLVILDEKNKKMTIMALSRDTMTEIRRYTRNGKDMGTYVSHLGYAYSYGDGGEASCENLKEAVSNLLGGIPIDEYAVTNQSSMTYLNNLVGGVTVTVPNNDLAELYPELTEGAVVKLDDTNVRDYLHYRDTSVSFSNEGRVERQQTYVTAYINQLKTQLTTDLEGSWQHLQEMDDYLLTSITKSQYIAMANLLETVSFTDSDYYRPTGENKEGELHDEFYLDEDAFQQKIIELFYEER
ncbi:MAG: LCP family protein [Eubacteriales bacterium]|nr:LCP family protein [Eubacteriales bacterium]